MMKRHSAAAIAQGVFGAAGAPSSSASAGVSATRGDAGRRAYATGPARHEKVISDDLLAKLGGLSTHVSAGGCGRLREVGRRRTLWARDRSRKVKRSALDAR